MEKNFELIAKAEKWSVTDYIPSDLGKKRLRTSSIYIPAFKKIKQFSEC